jgi:thymidylate kinase
VIREPRTIHLEGMDLAGKSTACRGLQAVLGGGWRVRRNALCDDNPVYALADRLRREDALPAGALGHLYVAAVEADLARYRAPGPPTVQDSTILLRSLAYHSVRRTPLVPEALAAALPRHPRFDVSVVLTASLEVRLARLDERSRLRLDEVAPDDLLVRRDPARFLAMEQVLVDLACVHFGARVIDTSYLTEGEVVGAILDEVENAAARDPAHPRTVAPGVAPCPRS